MTTAKRTIRRVGICAVTLSLGSCAALGPIPHGDCSGVSIEVRLAREDSDAVGVMWTVTNRLGCPVWIPTGIRTSCGGVDTDFPLPLAFAVPPSDIMLLFAALDQRPVALGGEPIHIRYRAVVLAPGARWDGRLRLPVPFRITTLEETKPDEYFRECLFASPFHRMRKVNASQGVIGAGDSHVKVAEATGVQLGLQYWILYESIWDLSWEGMPLHPGYRGYIVSSLVKGSRTGYDDSYGARIALSRRVRLTIPLAESVPVYYDLPPFAGMPGPPYRPKAKGPKGTG